MFEGSSDQSHVSQGMIRLGASRKGADYSRETSPSLVSLSRVAPTLTRLSSVHRIASSHHIFVDDVLTPPALPPALPLQAGADATNISIRWPSRPVEIQWRAMRKFCERICDRALELTLRFTEGDICRSRGPSSSLFPLLPCISSHGS